MHGSVYALCYPLRICATPTFPTGVDSGGWGIFRAVSKANIKETLTRTKDRTYLVLEIELI